MINISLLQFLYNTGQISGASSSNCIQCYQKRNTCNVFTLLKFWTADLFILQQFTQNNVERKVNEFDIKHKELKFLQTAKVGRKGSSLWPGQ